MDKISFGKKGEAIAQKYLTQNGYTIIDTNYHSRYGEIDIIACKDAVYVFVEVKARRSLAFGTPGEAVGYSKQKKLILTAYQYIDKMGIEDKEMRFDVIEVYISQGTVKINQIKHAFYA